MGLFNYLFRRLCNLVFWQVDYNSNGVLDALEVEVAVLNLYNVVNKRLPGWQDPPTRARIKAALLEYDYNKDSVLNQEEFCDFARALMHAGPDTFFARIGKSTLVQTALVPGVTMALQRVVGPMAGVPTHFLAPAVGVAFSTIRGLIPA